MSTAPSNPSLPQNDSPAQQQARQAQINKTQGDYTWGDVDSLPEVPVLGSKPLNELPTLEWWVILVGIAVQITRNHVQVKANQESESTIDTLAAIARCDEIEKIAAAIAKDMGHAHAKSLFGKIIDGVIEGVADLVQGAEHASKSDLLQNLADELYKMITDTDVSDIYPKSSARTLDTYRELFATLPTPAIAYTFIEDEMFARLRVAGPNCMLITGIDVLPANFALTEEQYASVVNGDTLSAALADGRVYMCDYSELSVLQAGTWDGEAKYCYEPIALFAVPPGGTSIVPVAIQCGQDSDTYPAMLPTNNAGDRWGWEMAKQVVQVADGNYHELFAHLARTHLVIEAVAIAGHRHLANIHPVWALLVPHFEGTLFINDAAAASLIAAGGPIDHIFGGTIVSSQQTAADARLSFHFYDKMLPADLAARSVADAAKLPDFPYRDDALLVWDAIHEWANEYIALYYADDGAVTGDTELAAWAASLAASGKLKGFDAITTRAQLIDVCTMVMFTASAQHAAVNFPQKDVMSFAPAVTGGGWAPVPSETSGNDKSDWLAMMPPPSLALEQLEVLWLLGSIRYRALGDYRSSEFPYPDWFTDPKVTGAEGPLPRFQAALKSVEDQIVARNANRLRPYPYLQPSQIPTSINI